MDTRAEAMMPVYENLYVKQFVLYDDESVSYYFQESGNGEMTTTDKKTLETDKERIYAGKYQQLNEMTGMALCRQNAKKLCWNSRKKNRWRIRYLRYINEVTGGDDNEKRKYSGS